MTSYDTNPADAELGPSPLSQEDERNSEPSWTPGPWQADPGLFESIHIQASGTAKPIAEVWPSGGDAAANARLMAAAPELHEALTTTLSHLKLFTTEHDSIAKAVWDQAEAALAKAEGRQP